MKPIRAVEVCIDVVDPRPVAEFWAAFLGYEHRDNLDDRWVHLEPPAGLPVINLQRVPEPKSFKNRLHLDVYADDPEDWVEHAIGLGATRVRVNDDPADWFCVMNDPAGNEFCICREQNV